MIIIITKKINNKDNINKKVFENNINKFDLLLREPKENNTYFKKKYTEDNYSKYFNNLKKNNINLKDKFQLNDNKKKNLKLY